ncbi:family 10 glycosylhydrolase [Bremerella cremea]|uniref:family 10 glycosylhydrolase n=1 Tax=Bremerella cremea TaxID=1031537 RepID=UPI0031EEA146
MLARLVQGSPGRQHMDVLLRPAIYNLALRCVLLCALVFAVASPAQAQAQGPPPVETIRSTLRVAWGGSSERRWRGTLALTAGKIRLVNLLGMEADEARAVLSAQGRVEINHLTPRIYDGFDIQIEAPAGAQLTIQLSGTGTDQAQPISIPISSLMHQPYQAALDEQGSRILVQRAPGDTIRTDLNRDHLVFAPEETFRATITGYRTNFPPGTSVQVLVKLRPARAGRSIWEKTFTTAVDNRGDIHLGEAIDVEVPVDEGVYELVVLMTEQRLTSLVFASKPTHQRVLQFVVIDPELEFTPSQEDPRPIASFDPTAADWWPRLSKLASYSLWQKSKTSELHNNLTKTIDHNERKWQQLQPTGWHAYPLPIEAIGAPLVVEVEYPSELPQSLGISIIEPDAAGMITPIGIDSGVEVSPPQPGDKPGELKHQLVFWPRTSTPMLLLTCRDKALPSTYGRISVLAGRPKLGLPASALEAAAAAKVEDDRLAIAYWDKPLFSKGFGAPEDLNIASNRSLEDWLTFLEGSNRVIEHLKRVGFNAACISMMSEGGSLYPSPHFRSTPKFDKGLFFDDGRDPFKKDVAELLFRQFDRANLRLIPAMELNAPLVRLEEGRVASLDPNYAAPLNHLGQPAIDRTGVSAGEGAYYNPLDEDVQQAISDLVLDFVSRYGHHPSFSGLALNLDCDGYAVLAGPQWGMDNATLLRFAQSLPPVQQQIFANLPPDLKTRSDWVLEQQWDSWLRWRGERMFQLHSRLATIMRSANSNAVLYLNTAGCFHGQHAKKRLTPELPRTATSTDVLLELGIDAKRYRTHPNISLLDTNFVRPRGNPKRGRWYINYQAAREDEVSYADEDNRGVLHFHVPDTLHVAGFDQAKPFGRDGNFTWVASEFIGSGSDARKPLVEHLAQEDDLSIFFGGWTVPMGQDAALHEFLTIYKMLPRGNYHRLNVPQSQPLVIRKLSTGSETTLYFVNPTPWDLNAALTVQLPSDGIVTPLASSEISRGPQPKGEGQWSITIPAYGLIACKVDVYDVAITGAKVYLPTGVMRIMRERLEELALRVRSIRSLPPVALLANGDFEQPATDGLIPAWTLSNQPGTAVGIEKQKIYEGNQSLRLKSTGQVVWARSEEIEIPESRRLMLKMHLLNDAPGAQPNLRIVLDGYVGTQNVYRPVSVGAGTPFPLQAEWSEFAYPVLDLPPELETAKIGFDMMGDGNVLVDRVELYDVAFRDSEINQLNKLVTLAYARYQQAEVGDCYRLLNGYWVKYLEKHVPIAPALAQQLEQNRAANVAQRNAPKEEPPPKTWFETFRSYTPRLPRFQ